MLKLASLWLLSAGLVPAPVGFDLPLGAATEGTTAHVVESILEYTRWPRPTEPIRLCVAGPTGHGGALGGIVLDDGRRVHRIDLADGGLPGAGQCDVVYLGRLAVGQLQRATAAVRGQAVVTIAEADPGCHGEAMFCLVFGIRSLSFRLNIDAVSRSQVRIDPRVLRLAQGGGEP